jgi:hypothetical protein
VIAGWLSGFGRQALRGHPMPRPGPQDESRLRHDEEDTMTYNSPEFIKAEVCYRRERLARDWQTHHAVNSGGSQAHRTRAAIAAIAGLGVATRRRRHA